MLAGDVLLGNNDSTSSAPLPNSCVELPETGTLVTNSSCSPSSTFRIPSQTEKDESRGTASANRNPPESDLKNTGARNTMSTAQVIKRNTASEDERSSTPEINFVAVDLFKKDIADLDTDVGKRQSAPVIATNNASIVSLLLFIIQANKLLSVILNSILFIAYISRLIFFRKLQAVLL